MSSGALRETLDQCYRESSAKMRAALLAAFRSLDLELAEDLVQESFLTAMEKWQEEVPRHPEAWLFRVCRNKALNYLKKQQNERERHSAYYSRSSLFALQEDTFFDAQLIRDSKLRLLFALCHPSLPPRSQVCLALKTLGGLTLKEIARGLGLGEETVKKIIFRARKSIKEKNLPLKTPFVLQNRQRLASVHFVLYLMFSEGYYSVSGEKRIRKDLCLEAMSLLRQVLEVPEVARPESQALYALMLFNVSRFEARYGENGEIIDLEQQDRKLWQAPLIQLGGHYLRQSQEGDKLSRYHLEAGIASLHCTAADFAETRWDQILRYYDLLMQGYPSVYVRFNRAWAFSYTQGPEAGITALLLFTDKDREQISFTYYLALGKMYRKAGKNEEANTHLLHALHYPLPPEMQRYIRSLIPS